LEKKEGSVECGVVRRKRERETQQGRRGENIKEKLGLFPPFVPLDQPFH
jgi:hypothetical protein